MDKLTDSLELLLLISIPESLIAIRMAMLILGVRVRREAARLLSAAVAISVLQLLLFLSIPAYFYFWYSIIVVATVIFIAFRELSSRTRLLIISVSLSLSVLLELVIVSVCSLFIEPHLIRSGPVSYKLVYVWPIFAFFALLCAALQRFRWHPGFRIARYVNAVRNVSLLSFLALLALQLFVLSLYVVVTLLEPNRTASAILFAMGLLSVVVVPISALHLMNRAKQEAVASTRAVYLGDLLAMFDAIRRQKHDFINHVQVMYTLLGMNKKDRLADYMEQVVEDIDQVGGFADSIPLEALAPLLSAKAAFAVDRGIGFAASTPERMEGLDPLYITDLVRVTGLLVDLAFEQAAQYRARHRSVSLVIAENDGAYAVSVTAPRAIAASGWPGRDARYTAVRECARRHRGRVDLDLGEADAVRYTVVLPIPK